MPLASKVKYIENMTEIKKDQGLWNTPLPIALHRSLLDVDGCRMFTEVIVTEGSLPYVHTLTINVPGVSSEQIMGRQPKPKPQGLN